MSVCLYNGFTGPKVYQWGGGGGVWVLSTVALVSLIESQYYFIYSYTVHVGAKSLSVCEKGHLSTIYKMLLPLASEWENIGLCLGLDNFEESINASTRTEASRLRETLKLWLSRVDPPPTREELAKAVEPFDPNIARSL